MKKPALIMLGTSLLAAGCVLPPPRRAVHVLPAPVRPPPVAPARVAPVKPAKPLPSLAGTWVLKGPGNRRQSVVSAASFDGLNFAFEPGYRLRDKQAAHDTAGITAAEVIPPERDDDDSWTMFFSAWQDVPAGTEVPLHPSRDPGAANTGLPNR